MRPLYLIRHASPVIQPGEHARDWPMSERGIEDAAALAATTSRWGLEALYSSSEAKARGTALVVGDRLGLRVRVADAFDELRIGAWIGNSDEFNELVRAIFDGKALPRRVESAEHAAARFAAGVRIIEQRPLPAAVVAHGRIMTSYLLSQRRIDAPFEYWRECRCRDGYSPISMRKAAPCSISNSNAS